MACHLDPTWYFGRLSRSEADSFLHNTKAGTYLVRDSGTSIGDYVLCVSENCKVSHYIIQSPQHTVVNKYVIGDQSFSSLPEVLEFYKLHFLDTTTLTEPCQRHPTQRDVPDLLGAPVAQNACGPAHNSQIPPPLPPMNKSAGLGLVCKAQYNFTQTDDEDLSFCKGDILTIIRKDEDQWWLARNNSGREGLVPANYIKPVNELENRGAGDGRQSTGEDSKTTTNNDQYRQLSLINPNTVQYAIVEQGRIPSAYDPTQLKLEVGSIIKVLERNVSGNWKGEVNGKQGFFPFTRVRLLDQSSYEELMEKRRKAAGANANASA
ncbi:adapter molecule Crk-like [Acanthaster planci]|uniref:Adapter molecule Crk-like n=1 Tax=Acanthaster planci TaxID=133434 RepID=A0A8B7Z3Z8_ACAPL|nr:adapter molecule Crk-like [Acanthaster planci]